MPLKIYWLILPTKEMSGSLIVGVNPSNQLQNCEVTAAGHLKMDIASSGGGALSANVDVTGNSIGLATSALQTTGNTSLATLAGAVSGSEFQVDVITSALPSGAATESSLSTVASNTTSLAAAVSGNELQVDVITSALPSGAATEATLSSALGELQTMDASLSSIQSNVATSSLQTAGNSILTDAEAHLGTIDTSTATASTTLTGISAKLPAALGQDIMSDSLSVVIASNQSSIPVSSAGANVSSSSESASPGAGVTTNSTAADLNGFQHVAIFGNSNNTTDLINVQISADNSTFYVAPIYFVSQNYSTGDFGVNISDSAARYIRISQGNTTGSGKSLTIITSKK